MIKHGTWLVADIYNDDYLLGKAREFKIPEESIDKEKLHRTDSSATISRKAVKAGVKVAFGTDAGVYPHGDNARQFAYMVKYGLTPARRSAQPPPTPPNCSAAPTTSAGSPQGITPT